MKPTSVLDTPPAEKLGWNWSEKKNEKIEICIIYQSRRMVQRADQFLCVWMMIILYIHITTN